MTQISNPATFYRAELALALAQAGTPVTTGSRVIPLFATNDNGSDLYLSNTPPPTVIAQIALPSSPNARTVVAFGIIPYQNISSANSAEPWFQLAIADDTGTIVAEKTISDWVIPPTLSANIVSTLAFDLDPNIAYTVLLSGAGNDLRVFDLSTSLLLLDIDNTPGAASPVVALSNSNADITPVTPTATIIAAVDNIQLAAPSTIFASGNVRIISQGVAAGFATAQTFLDRGLPGEIAGPIYTANIGVGGEAWFPIVGAYTNVPAGPHTVRTVVASDVVGTPTDELAVAPGEAILQVLITS